MPANTYDAIIVGSGITGGWAAKELTEKGLNVLILEAGRTIVAYYGTATDADAVAALFTSGGLAKVKVF